MTDDTVPLREYLEMRIEHQRELRNQDRDYYLNEAQNMAAWREQVAIEMSAMKARIATIAAIFTALLALIQVWRGTP